MHFSTGPQSQKARNLDRNQNCVICVEQDREAVIIEVVVRKLSAVDVTEDILSLYRRKYKWDMRALGNAIYAAYPTLIFGMDEKRGPQCLARWKFPASRLDS
jgi:hypothetical protein